MKLPRDLSGVALVRALGRVGYQVTRQTGSHVRLTTSLPTRHHLTVPAHDPLKLGTLAAVLGDVAAHLEIDRDELLRRLFG
jgi:predicted RNA binding protein YcfA (HicA-like mRNA interferase family)